MRLDYAQKPPSRKRERRKKKKKQGGGDTQRIKRKNGLEHAKEHK